MAASFTTAPIRLRWGPVYAMERPLASAFSGEVRSRIVEKAELENVFRDSRWSRLIETYSPLRAERDRSVLAVAGFSIPPRHWGRAYAARNCAAGGVHGAITLAMLALLATLVRKANDTITATQRELNEKRSRNLPRCWFRTSISTTG